MDDKVRDVLLFSRNFHQHQFPEFDQEPKKETGPGAALDEKGKPVVFRHEVAQSCAIGDWTRIPIA